MWWRRVVGGWRGGAAGWSWVVGMRGRAKSLSGPPGTDAVTPAGAINLLEGRREYLSPASLRVPGEILGFVRAAASSSSHSFLKVLLGSRRLDGIGAWWMFPVGAAVAGCFSFRSSGAAGISFSCFSLVFSGHDCAVCPSDDLLAVLGGCYINIAGRKPISVKTLCL